MSADVSRGLNQVYRIASLCNFLEHPRIKAAADQSVPVTMPPDRGSLGFDTPLWIGLGIVGLWAALDAYAERSGLNVSKCPACGGRTCLVRRFKLDASGSKVVGELEDLRHLFAHNFAGHADAQYFSKKGRHVLISGTSYPLSSGALFDGTNIQLGAPQLRYYAKESAQILKRFVSA